MRDIHLRAFGDHGLVVAGLTDALRETCAFRMAPPRGQQGGRRVLEDSGLDEAIGALRAAKAKVEQVTLDYANHVLHGERGHTERTTWGGYTASRGFHFAWNDYEAARMRSDGSWYCSACWEPASTEHEKDECDTCSDWGGCGRDCTLSAVKCARCGTRLSL